MSEVSKNIIITVFLSTILYFFLVVGIVFLFLKLLRCNASFEDSQLYATINREVYDCNLTIY